MTSPVPTGPKTMPEQNPLNDPAAVAHGWLHRIEALVATAKAELSKFIPAEAINTIESQAEQDVQGGIQIVKSGETPASTEGKSDAQLKAEADEAKFVTRDEVEPGHAGHVDGDEDEPAK